METLLLIPAQKVPKLGRELKIGHFQHLVSQLEAGEKLVGMYLRGEFMMAPHLHSFNEYQGFERHVQVGLMECLGYYAVAEDEFLDLAT